MPSPPPWPGLAPELLLPLQLVDSRRLTGPNVHSLVPVAIAELTFASPAPPADEVERLWREEIARMLLALQWTESTLSARSFFGGINVTLSAPIDLLLVATEVNEWAVASAAARLNARPPLALDERAAELRALALAQRRPALLALQAEAARRQVPFLWDDEIVSLGMGKHSQCLTVSDVEAGTTHVEWSQVKAIPVALVTGTNGKTTCARLLARMAKEAGFLCGNTASDGVAIDGAPINKGDWTGPAAARMVLRDARVELAVLETARGGILRRGLAVAAAHAALITNVSADHFGGYGVDDLAAMAHTKSVIAQVVRPDGRVVLNAADASLLALVPRMRAPLVFFARDADTPALRAHLAAGGEGCFVRDGRMVWARGDNHTDVVAVTDAPLTFEGRAPYNIENALGCIAMARALDLPWPAIVRALKTFGTAATDNPGRGNLHDVNGVKVLIDFGHNPHAISGALALAEALRATAGRLFVITGGAGDRSDDDLRAGARAIALARPWRVFCRELRGYERGRVAGEVPKLIADTLVQAGLGAEQVHLADSETAALSQALSDARPHDFILLLVHLEREGVAQILQSKEPP